MRDAVAAGFAVLLLCGYAGAHAQTLSPAPPPPVAITPAPATGTTISPILVNPSAPARPTAPAPTGAAPIDQQKQSSYRSDLSNRLRELDNAGVSPGSEQYREYREQLNQLNR